jgi:hypothetical protein
MMTMCDNGEPFLLPWEKVVCGADRKRESHRHQGFSLISHALHDSFSRGRSGSPVP